MAFLDMLGCAPHFYPFFFPVGGSAKNYSLSAVPIIHPPTVTRPTRRKAFHKFSEYTRVPSDIHIDTVAPLYLYRFKGRPKSGGPRVEVDRDPDADIAQLQGFCRVPIRRVFSPLHTGTVREGRSKRAERGKPKWHAVTHPSSEPVLLLHSRLPLPFAMQTGG